jgi:hypothetical protein
MNQRGNRGSTEYLRKWGIEIAISSYCVKVVWAGFEKPSVSLSVISGLCGDLRR